MNDVFTLIAEVGAPIAGALIAGVFIFVIMQQIMGGVVGQIGTLKGFCEMLVTRIKTMNNDILKIDQEVSEQLGLPVDTDRIARADGKADARKD